MTPTVPGFVSGETPQGCPPGFVLDLFSGECVPDVFDVSQVGLIPPFPLPQAFTQAPPPQTTTDQQSQASVGSGAVAVANAQATAINNAVNNFTIQNNVDTGPIGSAISSGIGDVVNAVAQSNQQIAQTVQGSVSTFANGLFQWAQDLGKWILQHIRDVLAAIGTQLKNIVGTVIDTVTRAVKGALDALTNTIGPIIGKIAQDIQKVVQFYQDHIQPVIQAVGQATAAIAATEKAIQADLHAGIQGLLQLPTDIANGLQQLDQAIIRAGLALRVKRKADADVYFYGDEPGSFAAHIKGLGDAVIGLGGIKEKTTYSPGKESLSEPTLAQELPVLIDSVYTILHDVCAGIGNTAHDWTGVAELLGITGASLAVSFVSPFLLLGSALAMVRGPFNVVSELAEQRAFSAAPVRKLEASELVEAVRRGFIDTSTMDAELRLQGIDGHRSDLLRRLSVFLEPASALVDYLFRQIITDDDFASGLHDLGYTDDQIVALKEGSTRILDVQDILTAWRRDETDEKTVDDTLRANRFTDAQSQLLKTLAFAPPGYSEAYRHFITARFLSDYGFDPLGLPQPPKEVRDAGRADGLSDDTINARWNGAIQTVDPSQWLALYWRGEASFKQLQVALDTIRIPDFLQNIWIDSQRPIIPFRTIPGMIKAGVLTESQGLQKLTSHGYTLEDATLLIKYARATSSKGGPARAAAQHEVSIAVARSLYGDGAITKDQYGTILKEHGFDDANVALEIQLSDLQDAARARTQFGTDVVNEFEAGFLTHDQAVGRLQSSNLSEAEQARYVRRLKSSKTSRSKLPSEAELRQMAIHQVISEDDYVAGLVANGYSQDWANRFHDLHFAANPNPMATP